MTTSQFPEEPIRSRRTWPEVCGEPGPDGLTCKRHPNHPPHSKHGAVNANGEVVRW